ncbi:hypothetical protein Hanom_Chr09g00821071 [Helianthus anomalus]
MLAYLVLVTLDENPHLTRAALEYHDYQYRVVHHFECHLHYVAQCAEERPAPNQKDHQYVEELSLSSQYLSNFDLQ